jgi:hypothetical protein
MALPDVFSVTVNTGTGGLSPAIAYESASLVSSVARGGVGFYNYVFNSGQLTSPPTVTCSSTEQLAEIDSVSANGFDIILRNFSAIPIDDQVEIHCQITKTGADAKQSVQVYKSIPNTSELVNSYNATVTSLGVVSRTNVDWINNVDVASLGITKIYTKGGIVTTSTYPTCTANHEGGSNVNVTIAYSGWITSARIDVYTFDGDTGAAIDADIAIECNNSSVNAKTPTVQPVIVGQVVNSWAESSSKNMRVETCRINSNATTGSGFCNNWIDSVSVSTSDYTLNFKSGIFSLPPICTTSVYANYTSGATAAIAHPHDATSSSISVETRLIIAGSMTFTDTTFNVTCIGER